MVRLFFAVVFVFPLLLQLFPALNSLVQNILQNYIVNFSGLHNLSLEIKELLFSANGLPTALISLLLITFTLTLILKMLKIL